METDNSRADDEEGLPAVKVSARIEEAANGHSEQRCPGPRRTYKKKKKSLLKMPAEKIDYCFSGLPLAGAKLDPVLSEYGEREEAPARRSWTTGVVDVRCSSMASLGLPAFRSAAWSPQHRTCSAVQHSAASARLGTSLRRRSLHPRLLPCLGSSSPVLGRRYCVLLFFFASFFHESLTFTTMTARDEARGRAFLQVLTLFSLSLYVVRRGLSLRCLCPALFSGLGLRVFDAALIQQNALSI